MKRINQKNVMSWQEDPPIPDRATKWNKACKTIYLQSIHVLGQQVTVLAKSSGSRCLPIDQGRLQKHHLLEYPEHQSRLRSRSSTSISQGRHREERLLSCQCWLSLKGTTEHWCYGSSSTRLMGIKMRQDGLRKKWISPWITYFIIEQNPNHVEQSKNPKENNA